jgi:hypothetical protein
MGVDARWGPDSGYLVSERTRVDLGRLRSMIERPDGLVLYLKGRYLPYDAAEREAQLEFDRQLLAAGFVSSTGRGPRFSELQAILNQRRKSRSAIRLGD